MRAATAVPWALECEGKGRERFARPCSQRFSLPLKLKRRGPSTPWFSPSFADFGQSVNCRTGDLFASFYCKPGCYLQPFV